MKKLAAITIAAFGLLTPAFSQTLSVEDLIEAASPAVVKIVVYDITGTKKSEGSGFFIEPGRIVTNAHVVKGAYSAEVHTYLETYEQVSIAKLDNDVDLAILEIQDAIEPTIALSDDGDIRPGQRVLVIGNPFGLERTVSDGLISAIRGIPGEIQIIQISAPISPGSSGGPLLNMNGYVIGVASASLYEGQNLNFAIGVETLKNFLQNPDNIEPLKKAQSRVLWRTILKWIGNIVLLIVVLVLGGGGNGGWWFFPIIILVAMFLFYILKGLWWLISKPFRRKIESDTLSAEKEMNISSSEGIYKREKSLSTEEEDSIGDESDNKKLFVFHCWKCGGLVKVDKSEDNYTVECEKCGTILEIPQD